MDASAQPNPFDPGDFRRALGMFATGVTIVTARARDGTPVGIVTSADLLDALSAAAAPR